FSEDGYLPAPLVALAAIAERTRRVTIGTDIMLASMWDPVRFAEEACVVDQLSSGRLVLGLATGYRDEEFEGLGFRRRDRADRMVECIRVLRQTAAAGAASGVGILPPTTTLPTSPLPFQPAGPPVLIGGFVEPAVRRAGQLADGHVAPQMGAGGLQRRIEWTAQESPGPGFAIAQSTLAFVAARDAIDLAAPGLGRLQAQSRGWKHEAGDGQVAPEWRPGDEWETADPGRFKEGKLDDELLTHALVIGTPEECVAKLAPFARVLASLPDGAPGHLAARLAYPAVDDRHNRESIRLYATEVIPALRQIAEGG